MKILLFVISYIFLFSAHASTLSTEQNAIVSEIKKLGDEFIAKENFAGIQIEILVGEKPFIQESFGFSDIKNKSVFKENTIVALGSNTKTYTSIIIQMLIDEKKIKLNSPIEDYLDNNIFKNTGITIEHLLCHTSGIPELFGNEESFIPSQTTLNAFSDKINHMELAFKKNDEYAYSNTGYFFLGLLIQKITKMSIGDAYREMIIAPLELNKTFYLGDTFKPSNMATSYTDTLEKFDANHEHYTEYRFAHAAGALGGSLRDYNKWTRLVMSGQLLPLEKINGLAKPCTLNNSTKTKYGKGIKELDVNGFKVLTHGGAINGYTSYSLYFPESDITVGFVTNTWKNPSELKEKLLEIITKRL